MSKRNTGEIRQVEENDWPQIYTLIERVFMRKDEARFMRELKEKNDLVSVSVIDRNQEIIGLIAYSRLRISCENKIHDALVMAPFIMDPLWQGKGLGSELIRQSHAELIEAKEELVFVLGEESYYGRFGYTQATAAPYNGPYDGPFLLACKWSDNAPPSGELIYPEAFANVIG